MQLIDNIYEPELRKIYLKAQKYCAYQERCQQEVRDKLYEWKLHKNEVEKIISQLIIEGFINEERFAIVYAGGKFRIKSWGKIKIKTALQQKKVTPYCINRALSEIDDGDYISVLKKTISSKSEKISEKNPVKKNYKLAQYAISRGFEPELVWDFLKE